MPQNFIAVDREQELLLLPSLREWLPEAAPRTPDALAATDPIEAVYARPVATRAAVDTLATAVACIYRSRPEPAEYHRRQGLRSSTEWAGVHAFRRILQVEGNGSRSGQGSCGSAWSLGLQLAEGFQFFPSGSRNWAG